MNTASANGFPAIPGYEFSRLIGHGGMADVYLATQLSLSRPVAIKVLAAERTQGEENVARFEHEARTIARMDHPHIVSIFDVGRTADGRLYYTMSYLPHGDLTAHALHGDQARIAAVVRAVCRALAYAHGLGIVHRDVKPGNVLFDRLDRPLLGDFGIALTTHDARVTREGSTIGSSGYMSPEQARGRALDGRADLYSLGVVTYELLCGELPFQGPDTLSMALAHVEQPVPRLPLRARRWQAFIDKAMAKNPADRFQSAAEMEAALDALEPATTKSAAPPQRSRVGLLAAASLILGAGLALAAAIQHLHQTLPPTRDTTVVTSAEPTAVNVPAEPQTPAAVPEPANTTPEPPPASAPPSTAETSGAPATPHAGATLRDADGPELVIVVDPHEPAGGFALARYEVTRADYAAFVRAAGRSPSTCREPLQPLSRFRKLNWRSPGFAQDEDHPVVCVSWNDANAYAAWLSQRTQAHYRLPTRAQWLLAARAVPEGLGNCAQGNLGGHGRLPFRLGGGNACKGSAEQTEPVGRHKANALGIFDLIGNAAEWVQDCKRGSTDKNGRCSEHLFVGSSWRDGSDANNLEIIGDADPDVGYTTVGIRLVRKLDDAAQPATH